MLNLVFMCPLIFGQNHSLAFSLSLSLSLSHTHTHTHLVIIIISIYLFLWFRSVDMIFSSFVVCRLECCSCLACFLSSYAVRSETESQRDLAHVTIKVSLWVVVPGLANTSSTPPRAPPPKVISMML